jgi:hypothetical protein
MPAIVLGIVGFILIEKSGGRLTGRIFAILGVVIPVLLLGLLVVGVVLPVISHERQIALRQTCGTNLAGLGKAMVIYANDYDGNFPRSGGVNATWRNSVPNWMGQNRFVAYGLASDGSQGQCTISSCFYLLVKYGNVVPKSFICPGDSGASEFKAVSNIVGDRTLIELWDFGWDPTKHCSYSYHQPFSQYPLTTSSEPGMAVAADRNPWIASSASDGKAAKFAQFLPTGGREAIRIGNALQHQEDGQNVLFLDNHVSFERNSFCGFNDDNIFTFWDGPDIRKGGLPLGGASEPKDKLDSFLVHDGYGSAPGGGR